MVRPSSCQSYRTGQGSDQFDQRSKKNESVTEDQGLETKLHIIINKCWCWFMEDRINMLSDPQAFYSL